MKASALLSVIFAVQPLCAQPDSAAFMTKFFHRELRLTAEARYLLYLPKTYGEEMTTRWPLVVFLHGSGERGSDLELVKRIGLARMIAQGTAFPFIVAAPQCPEHATWSVETLRALVEELRATCRVDTGRIYLTGASLGGTGTWELAIAYPELFAAIAPVCGRTDRFMVEKACRLRGIPVWAFHGAHDDVVPPGDSEAMVKALQACGGNVRFTLYPEANHNAWDTTYGDPRLYEWLLSQRRK